MSEYDSNQRDDAEESLDPENSGALASADALACDWLDAQPDVASSNLDQLAPVDAPTRRHLADLRFLHVLLSELHRSSALENSARVESVMATIRGRVIEELVETAAATSPCEPAGATLERRQLASVATADSSLAAEPLVSRRNWLISSAAVAAGLSGVAAWLWSTGSTQTAQAAILKIAEDARIPHDRQYRVTQELNHARGKKGRIESLLYVRGGEKFALKHRSALGNIWMGSNGRQGWFVPMFGAPIVTDHPRYPAKWSGEEGVALPDLKLSGLLDLMASRFQLSMLPNEPLPSRPTILCQRISGWCDANDNGPKQIELWAHLTTGVVERLVLQWARSPDQVGLTRIELDLLSETPQSDALYEVDTHRRKSAKAPKMTMVPALGPS